MRKSLLTFILFALYLISPAQNPGKSIQIRRDSLLKAYFQHRDTLTIRTWINVVTLNNYLEEIRKADSMLFIENKQSLDKPYQMINDLQDEIDDLTKKNKELQFQAKSENNTSFFQNTTFLIVAAIASIFLILFIVLFFGYFGTKKKAANQEKELRNYLARLNEANNEIEKDRSEEEDSAHRLNLLQVRYDEDLRNIRQEKSAIADEKMLLENQIIEVKKAYDYEVAKRMEKESELVLSQQQNQLSETSDEQNQKIRKLEEKIGYLNSENAEKNIILKETQLALERETNFRKNSEHSLNDLAVLLEKSGFLQIESKDFLLLTEKMKTYQKLLDENKLLADEVNHLRSNYDNEVKIKQQMTDDLNQIISKLKSDSTP